MKKHKKVLIYGVLMVTYFVILCVSIADKTKIEVAVNSSKYVRQECNEKDIIEFHDCKLLAHQQIEISGKDPYLVMKIHEMEVGSVYLQMLEKYSGEYKIYYASNDGFSEDRVATRGRNAENIFVIGESVNLIRIDFEGAVFNERYHLANDFRVAMNTHVKQIFNDVLQAFIVWGIYILVSGIYLYYLFKNNRFICAGVVWIYNTVLGLVWLNYISSRTSMFVNVVMLLATFVGMIFWGNNTILEEKKCVKE